MLNENWSSRKRSLAGGKKSKQHQEAQNRDIALYLAAIINLDKAHQTRPGHGPSLGITAHTRPTF